MIFDHKKGYTIITRIPVYFTQNRTVHIEVRTRIMINPKDIIGKFEVEDLCITAENYFKSIVDPAIQMGKPFSSLVEAPGMLQNIGLILSGLRLGKTMTVLDFGAGTC